MESSDQELSNGPKLNFPRQLFFNCDTQHFAFKTN